MAKGRLASKLQPFIRHWPLIVALAVLHAVVIRWVILSTEAQGGRLVYALDDPYIHMAIAKTWPGTACGGSPATSPAPRRHLRCGRCCWPRSTA